MRLSLLLVAGLLGGIAIAAQEEPDFSGHWVLESPAVAPPNVARELVVSQWVEWSPWWPSTGQSFPSTHIAIEQRFAGDVRKESYQIGLIGGITGGIDANGRGSGPNGQIPHTTFSTRWADGRLVIGTARYSGWNREAGPYTETREEWSLDADKLAIVKTTRSSTIEPTTIELTYRRGPP